jgi:hypothetical protein
MRLVLEKETEKFKWWPWLHGYWRTLPNFNPYTVMSDPGQDLADKAHLVLLGGHKRTNSDTVCMWLSLWIHIRLITILAIQDLHFAFSVDDNTIASASFSTPAKPIHSCHDSLTLSTHDSFSSSKMLSSGTKSKVVTTQKRSLTSLKDVFAEGTARENQMLKHLGVQKHKWAIGKQELKCRKLEQKAMEKQHQHSMTVSMSSTNIV